MIDWGLWALTPLVLTLVVAFVTRSALLAMLIGCLIGTVMLGTIPGSGLDQLFQQALGRGEFIWICEIVVLVSVLFELFKRAGVLSALARRVAGAGHGRRRVELTAWGLGIVIVDDYFSPLLSGAVLRPLSDRAGVPREKLAFLLDATTASVCILVPFTAWGAYLATLIARQLGTAATAEQGLAVFIAAIPYNFYPWLMLTMALLIAAGWLPDFGPMRRAERRVRLTGAVLRPGAVPLGDADPLPGADPAAGAERLAPGSRPPSLLFELALPLLLIMGIGVGSLMFLGAVKIVEAFLAGVVALSLVMGLRGSLGGVGGFADAIVRGAQAATPALLIVALAYSLNAVADQLGVGTALVAWFDGELSGPVLVAATFVVTAAIAFATGTSWGAFAMMMPVALPVALATSGGEVSTVVLQTVAAVAGGGIFGDHASPVSDTTVLSSVGAGSDHMDHVITQLPYALAAAALTAALYLLVAG